MSHTFMEREESRRLAVAMAQGGTAVLTQVVTGMGGVGKTQIATHYATALWNSGELDLLVWITATSRPAIVALYAQAAATIYGTVTGDAESAAADFLSWLRSSPQRPSPAGEGDVPTRWLIVLDDLNELDDQGRPVDMDGLWPPASPVGRTLVTTRSRNPVLTSPVFGRHSIEVGTFTEEESVAYLKKILAGRGDTDDEIAGVARDLGYLPLALSQAGAYMLGGGGVSCVGYRRQLADHVAGEFAALFGRHGWLPDHQRATVATAWSLSFDCADNTPPTGLARTMFEIISVLDPGGIPQSVLTGGPALAHLGRNRSPVSETQAIAVLRTLHDLSLINYSPTTAHRAVRAHQLVQRAVHESKPEDERRRTVRTAADALAAAWPEAERDVDLGQSLRSNTATLRSVSGDALWASGVHPVLFRAGDSLENWGQLSAGTDYFAELRDLAHFRLGRCHPDTLIARRRWADLRAQSGDPAEVITGLEDLLAESERVLGPEHTDTLAVREELAYVRALAGDLLGALTGFEQLLVVNERVLGPEHRKTLDARGGLAVWWAAAGDPQGAVLALEQLLPDRIRVLGQEHPDVFTTRRNLARYRGETGDLSGAVAEFERMLPEAERVLGADSIDMLFIRESLVDARAASQDVRGVLTDLEQMLVIRERVLGLDHHDTLRTRHRLAYWWSEAGDKARAIEAYRQLLSDFERVLGPDHSDTLVTRDNLAYELQDRARKLIKGVSAMPDDNSTSPHRWFAEAIDLFKEARDLTDPEKSPKSYSFILYDLAETYRAANDPVKAIDYYQQVIPYERNENNPVNLVITMVDLAHCFLDCGRAPEARAQLEESMQVLAGAAAGEQAATQFHNVGLAYERLGKAGDQSAYDAAMEAFNASLSRLDAKADAGAYATVLSKIGDMHKARENLYDAHTAYQQAVEYMRLVPEARSSLTSMLIDLARTSRRLGRLESTEPPGPPDK
ncbi:tetratricopeptide repeat protein [Streptomyces sp. NPDC050803]|uniref:tetratricopeptide repeat protein n=1 Tax=unclassified Streptomyces TaxID=2593676 RepID=UPI00343221E8